MQRVTVYTQEIPTSPNFLQIQKNQLFSLAQLISLAVGTASSVYGLQIAPTSPASANVMMGAGSLYQVTQIDPTAWSDLGIDTTAMPFQGINFASQTVTSGGAPFTFASPSLTAQQIPYLVEAQLQVTDSNQQLLPFFNTANPTQAIYGIGGSNGLLNTTRDFLIVTQVLTGATYTTPTITGANFAGTTSGGSLSNGTYNFKATFVNASGESQSSVEVPVTISGGGSAQKITYTSPAFPSGVTSTNLYASVASGGELLAGSTSSSGGTIVVTAMPVGTTAAPKYATPPATTSGWIPLAVITQNTSETTVVSGDIYITGVAPTVNNLESITQSINNQASGVTSASSSGGILVNGGTGPFSGVVTISAAPATAGGINAYELGGYTYAQVVANALAEAITSVVSGNPGITLATVSGVATVSLSTTSLNLTGQTAAISPTTLLAVPTNADYRYSAGLYIGTAATGGSGSLTLNAIWTDTNTGNTITYPITTIPATAQGYISASAYISARSGSNMQYQVAVSGAPTGYSYNLYQILERLG